MSKNSPKTIHLKDYTPPSHLIDGVALDVRFHPEETAVSARLAVRPNPDSPGSEGPLELDGESVGSFASQLTARNSPPASTAANSRN
jgi:aminopeptidase N